MTKFARSFCVVTALALFLNGIAAHADMFGSGSNQFTIDFVKVGNPGNAPDDLPNPAGEVDYEYRIGKYEVSEQMIDKANALSALSGTPLGITKDSRGPDQPATSITWFEAARFVNWLNTSTGSVPAYKFDELGAFQLWLPTDSGYDANNLYRNKRATYYLPSIDEWHKAAYYDPVAGHYWDYTTGSDTVPDGIDFVGDSNFEAAFFDGGLNTDPSSVTNVGLHSASGTVGQGGNIAEWTETAGDRISNEATEHRGRLGGSWVDGSTLLAAWNSSSAAPGNEQFFCGIRVGAVIPEPGTVVLIIPVLLFLPLVRRIRASCV